MTDNQIKKQLDFGKQSKSGIYGLSIGGLSGNICPMKSTLGLDARDSEPTLAATIRFTSEERDAETGLDYGVYPVLGGSARYYDSWSGTWMSVDPLAKKYPGCSPYNYVQDNPELLVDLTGMDPNGNNNDQQSSSNTQWQFGFNGSINYFNIGSAASNQQQVTLLGPQEVPLAPNGFGEAPTSPASQLLTTGASILSGSSSILTGIGAGLVVGGLFTEGSTVPEGALTLQMASYTEAGSFGLKLLNYKLYHVGNPSEIYGEGLRVAFDIAFSKFSDIALDRVIASEIQRGESEVLGLGTAVSSFFATPSNASPSQNGLRLQYVSPDVTASSEKGW